MFVLPVRIYYEDTDAGGIVYYANYLKYFERARTEWLRDLGIEQDILLNEGVGFVVKNINLDLKHPARFNDLLQVYCQPITIRKASILFKQYMTNQKDDLICEAEVLVACVAIKKVKPISIPSFILEEIKRA